jgi:sugar lactone lactonase YvrE
MSGATGVTQTVGYVVSGTLSPGFSLAYGTEYSISSPQCTGSGNITCTVSVGFQPRFPGLRQDALLAKDTTGKVIGTTLLYGNGLGPQAALYPGVISTIVGTGGWGYSGDGGFPTAATLSNPQAVAIDNLGNLYIADSINQVVREVSVSTGRITTVVGTGLAGYTGNGGPAVKATLNTPTAIAFDGAGNLYIADQGNNVIRKVSAATGCISTVAGGGTAASGPDGLGDGGPARNALLNGPNDVAVDGAGNLFIADSFNGLIRRVDASSGNITVAAGSGLRIPAGVAVDTAGNLYIADSGNSVIRRVDASSGKVTVVAGSGGYGYSGDLGPATSAKLGTPVSVRLDAAGNLYIADQAENVIRQVNAQSGMITTIAGTGAPGFFGDGGIPTSAALRNPTGVALDSAGNIYIADNANNLVRKVSQASTFAFPNTFVGVASAPQQLTVLNIGNQPLTFSGLAASSNFAQEPVGGAICSSSSVLASAASCTIAVAFVPTTSGNLSGRLTLTNNSRNNLGTAQSVSLTGTGILGAVPQLSISPSTLTFAPQAIGTPSSAQSITLSNPGSAALNISSIQLGGTNGGDFSMTSACPSVLAAKAICSISITFLPSGNGNRTAALIVVDNLPNSPQALPITGTGGTPQIAFSSMGLAFGKQPVGTKSPANAVTISNTGSADMKIVSIALSGTYATDFNLTSTCGATVSAGASCSVSVTFSPGAFGSRTAALTFTDNVSGSTQTINLCGTGSVWANPTVWRPSNGTWYRLPSSGTTPVATQWGLSGDIPVPGDYDGDGKIDFAVFRPSTASWWIVSSKTSVASVQTWGISGDIPVPADYDGDGKTDIAVFRPSTATWWIVSSKTSVGSVQTWGVPGDTPVPADYDGDGKADVAVFRPSNGTWWIVSSKTSVGSVQTWGMSGDIPVPADYDGDGKTDLAVFRPSNATWWIVSSKTSLSSFQTWGTPGDIPVPADYDGDGKADIAVFRPSNGTWWTVASKTGSGSVLTLGANGDIPLASIFR